MRGGRLLPVHLVSSLAEEHIGPADAGRLVVLRNRGADRLVIFRCPCGCRELLVLPLHPSSATPGSTVWRPTWHGDGTLSLSPSVVNTRCGAHFFVRHCRV